MLEDFECKGYLDKDENLHHSNSLAKANLGESGNSFMVKKDIMRWNAKVKGVIKEKKNVLACIRKKQE